MLLQALEVLPSPPDLEEAGPVSVSRTLREEVQQTAASCLSTGRSSQAERPVVAVQKALLFLFHRQTTSLLERLSSGPD